MPMLGPRTIAALGELLRTRKSSRTPPRGQQQRFAANLPKLGQAAEAIGAESSGSVQIWNGTPGSEADTGQTITAYNYFRYINSGDWVWCAHNGYGWYVVAKDSPPGLLGKTDAAHNKGANGTVSIYAGTPGSETDTTADVTAHNKFANIASGKWVWVAPFDSNWYITAAEC